ncbi:MAG: phosphate ABC transporter permease PstA [Pirellulales bacterium]
MSNGESKTVTTRPTIRRRNGVMRPTKAPPTTAGDCGGQAALYRYYVVRSDGAIGESCRDGTPERPWPSMADVLRDIARRHAGASPEVKRLHGYDRIEICALSRPHDTPPPDKKPQYEFFVDPIGTCDERGAGSAMSPWPSLEMALEGLARLEKLGAVRLDIGQRLTLTVREVFSASPVDLRRRRIEQFARTVLLLMTLSLVIPLVAILAHLLHKAWPVLTPSFLFENPKNNMTAGGIWAPLVGTFYLVFFSLLAAAPIGVLAGVYLNEYARDNWFTRIVNMAVVNLAGVPSIVHALFGVGAFVLFAGMGESVLAASCTLAVMTLPVIITSTKEALASVPMSFREACWNMGASRWQTIRTIVLPNSISGILTGVILQVSRAAGETAPILFTGAAYFVNVPSKGLGYYFPYSLDSSCMALSYHLHVVLTQVKGATAEQIASGQGIPLEQLQYGTAVVLIGLVLAVNSVSIALRMYLRSHKKW